MSALKDLKGQRFGRLLVVSRLQSTPAGQARWLSLCECGNEVRSPGADLRQGKTTSCGCAKIERCATINASHRMTGTIEYRTWGNMVSRCEPDSPDHHLYFDRGIAVCAEWRNSFEKFFAHIGPKPDRDLSIDRIDNDRGYEPGNVRWATAREQRLNQRGMKVAA